MACLHFDSHRRESTQPLFAHSDGLLLGCLRSTLRTSPSAIPLKKRANRRLSFNCRGAASGHHAQREVMVLEAHENRDTRQTDKCWLHLSVVWSSEVTKLSESVKCQVKGPVLDERNKKTTSGLT